MSVRTRINRRHPRRGFSLIEMLLVLVILILTAALVWPSLDAAFAHYELRQAAELVRVNLTSARVRAIDDGLVYELRFQPGAGSFSVMPLEEAGASVEATFASDVSAGPWVVDEVLPGGAVFAGAPAMAPVGAGGNLAGAAVAAEAGDVVLMFYPDGTTDEAVVVLTNRAGVAVDVSLRGLTGVVSVSELRTATDAM